jgi:hypothetical protein
MASHDLGQGAKVGELPAEERLDQVAGWKKIAGPERSSSRQRWAFAARE